LITYDVSKPYSERTSLYLHKLLSDIVSKIVLLCIPNDVIGGWTIMQNVIARHLKATAKADMRELGEHVSHHMAMILSSMPRVSIEHKTVLSIIAQCPAAVRRPFCDIQLAAPSVPVNDIPATATAAAVPATASCASAAVDVVRTDAVDGTTVTIVPAIVIANPVAVVVAVSNAPTAPSATAAVAVAVPTIVIASAAVVTALEEPAISTATTTGTIAAVATSADVSASPSTAPAAVIAEEDLDLVNYDIALEDAVSVCDLLGRTVQSKRQVRKGRQVYMRLICGLGVDDEPRARQYRNKDVVLRLLAFIMRADNSRVLPWGNATITTDSGTSAVSFRTRQMLKQGLWEKYDREQKLGGVANNERLQRTSFYNIVGALTHCDLKVHYFLMCFCCYDRIIVTHL
jgi:hypothetical protein